MAEKEERILRGELRIQINQFLWPTCKECGNKCKDEETIKFCRDSQPGMTRQEAINRIAKALCADDVMREGYYQMAEAVLNALLNNEK